MTNSTIAMSEKEASRIPILNDLLEKESLKSKHENWSVSVKDRLEECLKSPIIRKIKWNKEKSILYQSWIKVPFVLQKRSDYMNDFFHNYI